MLPTTYDAIKSILRSDPTVSVEERQRTLISVRQRPQARPPETQLCTSKVLSRRKAAEILGDKSLRYVDRLAQQGILKKVTVPGRSRAIGFRAADVEALIGSRAQ